MDIVLIPGFWLDASAWDGIVPALTAAGHSVHPVTLPGMTPGADLSGIHLEDHVKAVVGAIDAVGDGRPVVLVGHSAGGGLVYNAAGRRPGRVPRIVYVDSGPMAEGHAINPGLDPSVVAFDLPPWDGFGEADLTDLTDELRAAFRARALPQPGNTVREGHHHPEVDPADRRSIPATVITCEFPEAQVRELAGQGHPFFAELGACTEYEVVGLPTGHWPMFTRPADLADTILAAVDRD
ncbi:MAG: alpha/beta hydrolase [Promicromonosporaceae bacterium]|nr:alpha/beta hydrolase [Promicromonosporaceae bacterium]